MFTRQPGGGWRKTLGHFKRCSIMKITLSILCLSGISLLAAFFYPYGHSGFAISAVVLALTSIFVALAMFYYQWSRARGTHLPLLSAATVAILAFFVCTTRQPFDEVVPMPVNGTVTRLYRSQNHQYPGAELQDASRRTIRLEPIPETSWTRLRVGDHITKEAFSTHFTRGGDRIPAVEPSPLHTVRGASL
jgi:hypothetical protein